MLTFYPRRGFDLSNSWANDHRAAPVDMNFLAFFVGSEFAMTNLQQGLAGRVGGCPIGLSILAAPGQDRALLDAGRRAADLIGTT